MHNDNNEEALPTGGAFDLAVKVVYDLKPFGCGLSPGHACKERAKDIVTALLTAGLLNVGIKSASAWLLRAHSLSHTLDR